MSTQPWVEKYRPKQVSDVSHQEEVINTLTKAMESANMPHLLFYGPPGTGKTTTALAIGNQLFGPELGKTRVMELNASDERGISIVRNKIKQFASHAVGQGVPGYPCPPYKLLILDEADSMTPDAQNALRRTMEQYSKVTRFCFICNYVSRIIEPIASRCAKFRFKPLHEEVMTSRITYIAGEEGVKLEAGAMETLGRVSGGDMRKAITTMQSASSLHGERVGPDDILHVAGVIPDEGVTELVAACKKGSFEQAQRAVEELGFQGYPALQVLLQLQEHVVRDASVSDVKKARACLELAAADKCLVDGADEKLQLLNAASKLIQALAG